jgi:hypothetical protein
MFLVVNFKGPAAIIRVFRAISMNLYDQKYLERRVRPTYVSILRRVEQFLEQVISEKIVNLSWLKKKLESSLIIFYQ